jgi:hypothetical protein
MATSFISEHTAELSVIPYLKEKLEVHFDYVVPVFPWLTRETGNISKHLHQNDQFKVLAVFPRRPKIKHDERGKVFATINPELLQFKEFAEEYGVASIAGCPVSDSFWKLASNKRPVFLKINQSTTGEYLYPLKPVHQNNSHDRLPVSAIVKMVRKSNLFNVEEFQDFLYEGRHVMPHTFFWGARYKPTYFLVRNR